MSMHCGNKYYDNLFLQESHKSLDDDAELEAEIQRELEEEAKNNAEQKEKEEQERVGTT